MTAIFRVLLLSLFMTTAASANDYTQRVPSGESTEFAFYFAYNPDCTFKPINVDITTQPTKGTVQPRFGDYRIQAKDVRLGGPGRCIGKTIRAVKVWYTPLAGFRGTDKVSIKMTIEGMGSTLDNYTIIVE